MRITKLMGMAVVLVALGVVINALAFKTATVTNPATFTVQSSDAADTALQFTAASTPGTGFSAAIGSGGDQRQWKITINDKMQPNSVYTFAGVMKIKNNTADTVRLTSMTASGTPITDGVGVTFTQFDGSSIANLDLTTGSSVDVNMVVSVPAAYANAGGNISIAVTGTKQ